ncbi:DUF4113 domain-containing protein [uncultured Sphingomonas sp.]|uniref:DUF4113 domain-containing protein n=1 Tax=uncultured Sphingomonas sp. TaxID=158754 RepID=UPI0025EF03FE|nr:DUF4113 domain-containing protein [uncultured Sphingomonas sp.]
MKRLRRSGGRLWLLSENGYAYIKAGIMLEDLVAADFRPTALFEGDVERCDRLTTAFDEVNARFGKFTAVRAAQGFRRDWKMRAENRSPA